MAKKTLRALPRKAVTVFKIKNRRGYAAICKSNLTEGGSIAIAVARMVKAVKRQGFLLK